MAAAILASAIGVMRESDAVPRPRIFGYEHHNSDLSKFLPTAIVDVTDSFDAKVRAMNCFETHVRKGGKQHGPP